MSRVASAPLCRSRSTNDLSSGSYESSAPVRRQSTSAKSSITQGNSQNTTARSTTRAERSGDSARRVGNKSESDERSVGEQTDAGEASTNEGGGADDTQQMAVDGTKVVRGGQGQVSPGKTKQAKSTDVNDGPGERTATQTDSIEADDDEATADAVGEGRPGLIGIVAVVVAAPCAELTMPIAIADGKEEATSDRKRSTVGQPGTIEGDAQPSTSAA